MAVKCEQIDAAHNIVEDYDQMLTPAEKLHLLGEVLGDGLALAGIAGRRMPVYTPTAGKPQVLFVKNITYLGTPHPLYKKRIQLSAWYKPLALSLLEGGEYDVRYIGIYTYQGLHIFVDFRTDRYLAGCSHNSAAHVYVNDLYQALVHGTFSKVDAMDNTVTTVAARKFRAYLDGEQHTSPILAAIDRFNAEFPFGRWITAREAITAMHEAAWPQWKQTEWAGWLVEYLMDSHIRSHGLDNVLVYTGCSHKAHTDDGLDFDLYFPGEDFYGDLKASEKANRHCPGNDQEALLEALNRYGKFWYLIYEHDTRKDRDFPGNPMATWRHEYIPDCKSMYRERMKHSVRFEGMAVYEINRVNMHGILSAFNQGHQPGGASRRPKFLIDKRQENFIIYRHTYQHPENTYK